MVTEELVRNNMQRSRMLVEGSLSYDGLGEDPEWASCSHFLCIWNLEPNDSVTRHVCGWGNGVQDGWWALKAIVYF